MTKSVASYSYSPSGLRSPAWPTPPVSRPSPPAPPPPPPPPMSSTFAILATSPGKAENRLCFQHTRGDSIATTVTFSHDRSTSYGSSMGCPSETDDNGSCVDAASIGFKQPLVIKKTFLDFQLQRCPSLDGFFVERRAKSCPSSPRHRSSPETEDTLLTSKKLAALGEADTSVKDLDVETASTTSSPTATSLITMSSAPTSPAAPTAMASFAYAPLSPADSQVEQPRDFRQVPSQVEEPRVVSINHALQASAACDQFAVPYPEMHSMAHNQQVSQSQEQFPSYGSMGHYVGRCKPCAFYHTKGCGGGIECPFCHLCVPGAAKQRKKERLSQRREWIRSLQSGRPLRR